jgi:hypothetical protein
MSWKLPLGRGADLLRRGGTFQERAAYLLRGGALPLFLLLTLVTKGVVGHLAAISQHLAVISYTWLPSHVHLVHPPLLGIFTFCYLYKHSPIAI